MGVRTADRFTTTRSLCGPCRKTSMRSAMLAAALALLLGTGCKNEEAKKPPQTKPAAPVTKAPEPASVSPKGTRGPNSDKQDILGKWDAKGPEAMQFEFTPTNLTIRKGSDVKSYPYTLRNELSPSQLDWGTAADGGFGLYALDGKNLYIDYKTGGPDNRPRKIGKPTDAKQLEFQRAQ